MDLREGIFYSTIADNPLLKYNFSMALMAVIQTGGKQYLVKKDDTITVDSIGLEKEEKIELPILATFDDESLIAELGSPMLKNKAVAQVLESGKGIKIRVARFKAKSRYRRVTGFRPLLTKIQIIKI